MQRHSHTSLLVQNSSPHKTAVENRTRTTQHLNCSTKMSNYDNDDDCSELLPLHLPGVNVEEFARLTEAEKVAHGQEKKTRFLNRNT